MISMINILRPGILCLTLALVACSHDRHEATGPAKVKFAVTAPAEKKPVATLPVTRKPAQSKPVAEKPDANAIATNQIAILKPGQATSIGVATTLHYIRLISDSRCPVGTQCIWAGEAIIELTLQSDKEKQTFTLSDKANTISTMGFRFELISIDRRHLVNIRTQKF